MPGDRAHDAIERADAKGFVIGHRNALGGRNIGGEYDVAALLIDLMVTEIPAEDFDQFPPADIPGNFHAARISSRTRWSRMRSGAG